MSDQPSTDYLKKLYGGENDREIKKAIINSFGAFANGFDATGASPRKIQFDLLAEIVGGEKDVELRRLAFSNLERFPGWAANEQTLETVARLYDAEADEAFKISILHAFSGAKQSRALEKLMDIAKNDKSDRLRLAAIYALRTSKNPEVLRFWKTCSSKSRESLNFAGTTVPLPKQEKSVGQENKLEIKFPPASKKAS